MNMSMKVAFDVYQPNDNLMILAAQIIFTIIFTLSPAYHVKVLSTDRCHMVFVSPVVMKFIVISYWVACEMNTLKLVAELMTVYNISLR